MSYIIYFVYLHVATTVRTNGVKLGVHNLRPSIKMYATVHK